MGICDNCKAKMMGIGASCMCCYKGTIRPVVTVTPRASWAEADADDLAIYYTRDARGHLALTEMGRRKGYSI